MEGGPVRALYWHARGGDSPPIDRAGATNALLVTLLVPPIAILLGVAFLGEVLHPRDFAGLGLIALGLAAIDGRALSLLRLPVRRPQTIA